MIMSTKKIAIPTRRLPTKYYKYVYENWTQPVMSSNNQDGIKLTYANMSSSNIYTLFNGVSNSDYITPTSTTSYNSYVNIAFDYPIKLSNIKINSYTKRNETYAFGECKIVATTKDGQEITISTAKLPDSQAWADTNFPVDNLIIKNLCIYATSGGNPHPRIGEITLTAQKQTVVETTSSDYDYKVTEIKEYLPTRRMKKYYKYGTEPNATIVGNPTISSGVVSGFSTSNYLKTLSNFRPQAKTWEYFFKITTGSNVSTRAKFIGSSNGKDWQVPTLEIRNGLFFACVSTNGSSWLLEKSGITSVTANTTYYVRLQYTGSAYVLSTSKNNSTWTQEFSVSSTTSIYDSNIPLLIGADYFESKVQFPWTGSIDLTQSYIKISSSDWWRGTKAVISNSSDYDYSVIENKEYLPVR